MTDNDAPLMTEAAALVRSILDLGTLLQVPPAKARAAAIRITKEFLGIDLPEIFGPDFCHGTMTLAGKIRGLFPSPTAAITKQDFLNNCGNSGVSRRTAYLWWTQALEQGIIQTTGDGSVTLAKGA